VPEANATAVAGCREYAETISQRRSIFFTERHRAQTDRKERCDLEADIGVNQVRRRDAVATTLDLLEAVSKLA
jgi:sulfite reductase alpha subunit-like flavoprotein